MSNGKNYMKLTGSPRIAGQIFPHVPENAPGWHKATHAVYKQGYIEVGGFMSDTLPKVALVGAVGAAAFFLYKRRK